MVKSRVFGGFLVICGLLALAAGGARADDLHFGGWRFGRQFSRPFLGRPLLGRPFAGGPFMGGPFLGGPRFGAPFFGGPRFDGPRYYDDDVVDEPSPRLRSVDPRPRGPRTCYSQAETRERVASQKLREPFALMRAASAYAHAEALAGKLCHWNDLDIYEISLLRPDGRVVHVFMNAATGQVVGALNTH